MKETTNTFKEIINFLLKIYLLKIVLRIIESE